MRHNIYIGHTAAPHVEFFPARKRGWFRLRTLAEVLGICKKTVLSDARSSGWPVRRDGNRWIVRVPLSLRECCVDDPLADTPQRIVDFRNAARVAASSHA